MSVGRRTGKVRGVRGYFGIGIEGLSKAMNAGSVFRTAHAFGASFLFTVGAVYKQREVEKSDTSKSLAHVPLYEFAAPEALRLPRGCVLVGVELMAEAIELPSFRHPAAAAYVLGPERGSLSPGLVRLCHSIVKIPTRFSINVGLAAALVMYDRVLSMGRFAARPVAAGGPIEHLPPPEFGPPVARKTRRLKLAGG